MWVYATDAKSASPPRVQLAVSQYLSATPTDTTLYAGVENYIGAFRARGLLEPVELTTFPMVNLGDDETVDAIHLSFIDTDGAVAEATGYLADHMVIFDGLEVLAPRRLDRLGLIVVSVDADDGTHAEEGDALELVFVDNDAEGYGLHSGRRYDESVITNEASLALFTWSSVGP